MRQTDFETEDMSLTHSYSFDSNTVVLLQRANVRLIHTVYILALVPVMDRPQHGTALTETAVLHGQEIS